LITAKINSSLKILESSYDKLIDGIRKTQADFAQQQFGNAIRLMDQTRTEGFLKPLAIAGVIGAFLGGALGIGLSLLGVYVGAKKA
jgi:hypothetical protein